MTSSGKLKRSLRIIRVVIQKQSKYFMRIYRRQERRWSERWISTSSCSVKKVFHLVPILIENLCIVNTKKAEHDPWRCESQFVSSSGLNIFVFIVALKAYSLFLSYFSDINTSLLDSWFALHIVTYSGICSYFNNESSFTVKMKINQHNWSLANGWCETD